MMRNWGGLSGWLIAAAVAVVIAVVAYIAQPRQDSSEHSSTSDAANGTSAARLFAGAMGHPTDQIEGRFNLPTQPGVMFVFSPTSPYTPDEASRTLAWVRSGGVLIYASETGDAELDQALKVSRRGFAYVAGSETGTPLVEGVNRAAGADIVGTFDLTAEQVAVLRSQTGSAVGYLQRVGSGTVVVLADPLLLCNGYLDKLDNGRLLSDLLGIASPDAQVEFDEYHHGLILSDLSPQAWVTTTWGAALLWLLVAVFVGLMLRGRRLGPLVERPAQTARSAVEWSVAVGELLRRSSAREVTLGLLAAATERAVAARTGLPLQPRERFWNALWVRAPGIAADLAEAENKLHESAASERGLLAAAQRLHQIAHPSASVGRRHPEAR